MKRRHFLWGGAAAAVAASAGAVATDEWSKREIAAAVYRKLPMLKLDKEGVHAFARDKVNDTLAKRPTWFRVKFHIRNLFAKPGALIGLEFPYRDTRSRRERLEDNLVTMYLLSSDFFWNRADESRVVKYVALYNPIRACGNPFARPPPITGV